jgi:hypothetical protein
MYWSRKRWEPMDQFLLEERQCTSTWFISSGGMVDGGVPGEFEGNASVLCHFFRVMKLACDMVLRDWMPLA